jgi:cell division protein ZapD
LSDLIHFEFPLSERIRLLLRLEQLFQQVDYFQQGTSHWDARALMDTLLEILTILSRNDVKSELLKELDRNFVLLRKLAQNQHVDSSALGDLQNKVNITRQDLSSTKGKVGSIIFKQDFFQSIALRSPIAGGKCAFDLPWYHRWLEQPDNHRRVDIEKWLESLSALHQGIDLILNMIRQSTVPEDVFATAGFFQATLDQTRPYQLIRVSIDDRLPAFAEISGGKHRFTVRFLSKDVHQRPLQIEQDIDFQLTKCLL